MSIPAAAELGGRRYELGSYERRGIADLARDLALLLHARFQAAAGGGGGAPPPQLNMLHGAAAQELREHPDFVALEAAPSLEAAVQQLAATGLAEQLYYELFSVSSDDEPQEAQEAQQQQPAQAPPGSPAPAGGGAGGGSSSPGEGIAARMMRAAADPPDVSSPAKQRMLPPPPGEASAAQQQPEASSADEPEGSDAAAAGQQQPAPAEQQPASVASAQMAPASSTDVDGALQALAAMAALPAWEDDGSGSDGERGASIGSKRRALGTPSKAARGTPRRLRAAKTWASYPRDASRWAVVLSQSTVCARTLSLPWASPADMAAELLGADWMGSLRRRKSSGTVREPIVLVDGDEGERPASYALYKSANQTNPPQYIEKLNPILRRHSATVGDVLLLKHAGPGRVRVDFVAADTPEARCVHESLGFDVAAEQQLFATKKPALARQLSRQGQELAAALEQEQAAAQQAALEQEAAQQEQQQEAAVPAAQPAAAPPAQAPQATAAAPAAAAHNLAAGAQAVVHTALKRALQREEEQGAAAGAVEEMTHPHKKPRHDAEHGAAAASSHPPASTAAAAAAVAAPAAAAAAAEPRHPTGLSGLLKPSPAQQTVVLVKAQPAAPAVPAPSVLLVQSAPAAQPAAAPAPVRPLAKAGVPLQPPTTAALLQNAQAQLAMMMQFTAAMPAAQRPAALQRVALMQQHVQALSQKLQAEQRGAAAANGQPSGSNGAATAARPLTASVPAASVPPPGGPWTLQQVQKFMAHQMQRMAAAKLHQQMQQQQAAAQGGASAGQPPVAGQPASVVASVAPTPAQPTPAEAAGAAALPPRPPQAAAGAPMLLIRSTTAVPPPAAAGLAAALAQQQQQQSQSGTAGGNVGRTSPATRSPSPVPRPPSAAAGSSAAPAGAAQVQPAPEASASLARMQAALERFAATTAVRVPPERQQQERLPERLHALAGQLDALLAGFWRGS